VLALSVAGIRLLNGSGDGGSSGSQTAASTVIVTAPSGSLPHVANVSLTAN